MFDLLEQVFHRPEPFEFYTAEELWTDSHTSQQMLRYHLNPDVDLSSRKRDFIERSVEWIITEFSLVKGSKVADFGCGPGLYANRMAKYGMDVTGIDFSANSITYARERAAVDRLDVKYVHRNYLDYETDDKFDLIMMIMCDYCALSPEQRGLMLEKFHSMLNHGGRVLLDVYSMNVFENRPEGVTCAKNLMDGFWSADDYYGFLNTFKYTWEKVILDKYTIITRDDMKIIFNWLQYFSPADLLEEFRLAKFSDKTLFSDVAGSPFDESSDEFAIVARKD